MPFKFLPNFQKLPTKMSNSRYFMSKSLIQNNLKIPDTEHKTTVPEKLDMYLMVYVERLELSTLLFNCHSQFNSVLK